MPVIKLHLENAEYHALGKFAVAMNQQPEAVALCALRRLMRAQRTPRSDAEIGETWAWHRDYLPLWSTSDGGLHLCMPTTAPPPAETANGGCL